MFKYTPDLFGLIYNQRNMGIFVGGGIILGAGVTLSSPTPPVPGSIEFVDGTTDALTLPAVLDLTDTNTFTVIAGVRFASHPANGYYNFFNKQDVSGTRILSLYLNSNGSGTYFIHEGSTVQFVGSNT